MSLNPGNFVFFPDPYKTWTQVAVSPDGKRFVWQYARAPITDTLQTVIPLKVPPVKPPTMSSVYPEVPLVIPVGAQIQRVDFRLPRSVNPGEEYVYGIDLPKNCTIVGTTGENLKVSPASGTTHTVIAPLLTSVSNTYTPGAGVVLQRASGQVDAASPSLITTVSGSPLTLQMSVSNAGNTAAGNGIRLSSAKATAFIYASIVYRIDGDAVKPWNLDLPFLPS